MKRVIIVLLLALLLVVPLALAEEDEQWREAPVIIQAYEMSSGKLYIEWEGYAPVYQVYMDGKSVANVIVNNAVIDIKKGTHTVYVYPVNEAKTVDTKIDISLEAVGIGSSLGIDLAALGLDAKNLTAGTPSAPLYIDYNANPIFAAVPEDLAAVTDFDDHVVLSFTDRYYSDEYVLVIKIGKDVSYVRFAVASEESAAFVTKRGSSVTIVLDSEYLRRNEGIVPELGVKYTFTVQLRKYARNLVDGTPVPTAVHESKVSKAYSYTPAAAWKAAPVISYASQTADGQVTLQWTHDDHDLGCEYAVMRVKKTLGIRAGVEEVAVVAADSCVISDLMNGVYSYVIVPRYSGEVGDESEEITIDVKNDWVVAPMISCSQTGENEVELTWNAAEGVVSYHVTVYKGDNASLLRYVNLDYTKYAEYDIPVDAETMDFVFAYEGEVDSVDGERLKFEVYGVRIAANGDEQRTAMTTKAFVIRTLDQSAE